MTQEDDQTVNALRTAMATQVREHHLDPATTATVLKQIDDSRRTRRPRARKYLACAVACLVVAGAGGVVYAFRDTDSRPERATRAAGSACDGAVVTSAIPVWARDGFSAGAYVNPHVTGASGDIIGVLFVDPLRSPQPPGTNNKILWVARVSGFGPLLIRAQMEGSTQVVTRSVSGGPGPSIIDMPAPGCWRLTLTWSGHTDTTALPYAP